MQQSERPTADNTVRPMADNTVERAYVYLHDRAVSFGFRPGERLNEVELAAALGMSRAPVREALNRLIADGLAVFEPRKGFYCRKLSATEITDLFGVRADIELSAARSACRLAGAEAITKLRQQWQAVERDEPGMSIAALVDADEAFHLGIAALSGNAERVRFLGHINARIRFVRRINLEDEHRRAAALTEHAGIIEAISDRAPERAATLLAHHLAFSADEVMSHIRTGLARIYADEVA